LRAAFPLTDQYTLHWIGSGNGRLPGKNRTHRIKLFFRETVPDESVEYDTYQGTAFLASSNNTFF